jgi:hypothetical protein
MVTINTVDDLIEALKRDGKVRSAVRREILTEDLLAVPTRVDSVQQTQTEMLAQITALREDFGSMLKTQDGMLKTQDGMLKTQDGMLKTQDGMLKAQAEMQKSIEAILKSIEEVREEQISLRETQEADRTERIKDMHRFRGNYAADAAVKRSRRIAKPFSNLKGLRQVKRVVLSPDEVEALIDKAPEALAEARFTDDETFYTPEADLVMGIVRRRGAEPEFYVVAETSYTADRGDVDRALVRARVVGVATQKDAYAVVASLHLDPAISDRVTEDAGKSLASADSNSAFWFKIEEEDMEPPSPR